jgi:hypothetical protein
MMMHTPADRMITRPAIAATVLVGAALLWNSGCKPKEAPPAATPPVPHAQVSPTGVNSIGDSLSQAASKAQSSLGLDLPDVQIPTQDEIDAAMASEITSTNADAEFTDLEKDIDSDSNSPQTP